jgi:alkanesulfonate monooxygenase SsuD/methylene tetrahydromethanopterin reductase-like flavin-dependent oxidoreductase (luciferase family)
VKVGIILPLFSGNPERVLEAAHEAEELGFDGVFVFDHFFPPGGPRDGASLEAFTMLAAVGAATERITVGTLVTRASLRPAGLLAKTAAWIDAATGGRLVLGIGTGDPIDRGEHEAYGIPMLGKRERRAHLDETVRALKALFSGGRFDGGRYVPELLGPLLPPPARPAGPPVWIGAQAPEVVRLAGRIADGWNGWGLGIDGFAERAKVLFAEAESAGRSAEATWAGIVLVGEDERETVGLLERRKARGMDDNVWSGTPPKLTAFLLGLEEAGATWAVLVPAGPKGRSALIAREVLPALSNRSVVR